MQPQFDPRWEALNDSIPQIHESPEVRVEFLERERLRIGELDQLYDTPGWAVLSVELNEKSTELYEQLRRADNLMEVFRIQGRLAALEAVLKGAQRVREVLAAIDEELATYDKEKRDA